MGSLTYRIVIHKFIEQILNFSASNNMLNELLLWEKKRTHSQQHTK